MQNPRMMQAAGAPVRRTPRRLQRDVLRDVMLSAAECDTWLALDELARMTGYPPASISAQLRHLRKPRHGGYRLEKRRRVFAKPGIPAVPAVDDGFTHGPVWEYRLDRRRRAASGAAHRGGVR